MSKNRIVLTVGCILILMPFLGFPSRWENFFSVVSGLILVYLALHISVQRRAIAFKAGRAKKDSSAPFVDGYGSTPSRTSEISQDSSDNSATA